MKHIWIFLGLFLLSTIVFLAHFFIVGTAVYGDGRYYFSYLPTFYIAHSLNFSDAFTHFGIQGQLTQLDIPGNVYAIGPATIWALPYLLFYFILGANNPYSVLLQIPVGIFNIALVIAGLFLLYQTLQQFFPKTTSILTIVTLYLSTNLFFYGAIDVINSHSVSFFFAAVLVYSWLHKKQTFFYILLTGISVGMLFLIRTQDIIFLLLPLSTFIFSIRKRLFYFLEIIGIVCIFVLYQSLLWKNMWGNAIISPYLYHNYFTPLSPHIFGVLFNPTSGLFLWTPLIAVMLYGLYKFIKKEKFIGIPMMFIFLLELYIVASWNIWWEGASYSGRMFIATLPLLSFGLATLIEGTKITLKTKTAIGFFVILNLFLMLLFLLKVN